MKFTSCLISFLFLLQHPLFAQTEVKSFILGRTTFSCEYVDGRPINGYPEELVIERAKYFIYPKFENGQPNGDSLRFLPHYEVMEYKQGQRHSGCTPSIYYGHRRNTDFYQDGKLLRTQYMEGYIGRKFGTSLYYQDSIATIMYMDDTTGTIVYTKKYTDGRLFFRDRPDDNPVLMKDNALIKGTISCYSFDEIDLHNIYEDYDFDQCQLTIHNDSLVTVECRNEGSPFYIEYRIEGKPYRITIPNGRFARPSTIDWYFADNHAYYTAATLAIATPSDIAKAMSNAYNPVSDGYDIHYKGVETDELISVVSKQNSDHFTGIRLKMIDEQLYVIDLDDNEKVECNWSEVKKVVATLKTN